MESVFKEYTEYVFKKLAERSKKSSWWPQEFEKCHSDYERVLCLFNLLKPDSNATSIFGLPTRNPISDTWSRKKDETAIGVREIGNERWKEKMRDHALYFYTGSLFYAESPLQQALALDSRSAVLYSLACYTEAAEDTSLAIKLGFPKENRSRIHVRLGQCLLYLHNCDLATHHFRQAIRLLAEYPNEELLQLATSGLKESRAGCGRDYDLAWRCQHNIVDPLKWEKNKSESKVSKASPKLLAAGSNSSVCLRNSGLHKGWMLQTTRDIKPGIIILDKYIDLLANTEFLNVAITSICIYFCQQTRYRQYCTGFMQTKSILLSNPCLLIADEIFPRVDCHREGSIFNFRNKSMLCVEIAN